MSRLLAHAAADYGSLKDATRRLLDGVGGLDRAAELCRLKRTRLSQCASPYAEADYLPIDAVVSLELAARLRPVTDHLCARHGGVWLPLPSTAQSARWADDLAAVAREAGEVVARLAAALADGTVTAAEARELLRDVDEALAAFGFLRAHLAHAAGDGR